MKAVRVALLPLVFLIIGVMRLLRRFGYTIRIGEFYSNRLGHLAGNTECYLCERDAGINTPKRGFDIWTHNGVICSDFMAKMVSRSLLVDRTGLVKLVGVVNSVFDGWQNHVCMASQMDRDIYNLFEKQPPHLKFSKKELAQGEEGLRKLGIPKGAKWVYLIVRDSAKHPTLPYHSYRNTDIENYVLASKWLADRGYYVVRVGKKVLKPMPVNHPRIIDFSMREPYDDFMSVYLGAFCHFCVSTSTGPDAIPYIFRRPIVYTNFVPFEYLFSFLKDSFLIWKHHEKDGKRMSVKEIIESRAGHFMRTDQFETAGIKLIDNTPEEILDVVVEMYDWLSMGGIWDDSQDWFWEQFPRAISLYNGRPLHGELRMRIGSKFLEGYK